MDVRHVVTASIAVMGLVQLSPSLPPHFTRAEAAPAAVVARPPERAPLRDPVVFVVLDGVRWQELFRGVDPALAGGSKTPLLDGEALTPRLHAIMARGAALGAPGRAPIAASGPQFVSLPAYREIFSGSAALDCLDNTCAPIDRTTLVDAVRDQGGRASVFASWPTIERAVAKRTDGVFISTGRGAAERDLDPYPGDGEFRPDRATARAALEHLERERPDFLFVGLGEPDEYAHRNDYPAYLGSIRDADRTVGELEAALARMGSRGARTHVFVTTDHGRAKTFREHGGGYPESAAVWLVAWGPSIKAQGALVTERNHHLSDLAPTARTILGIAPAAPTRNGGVVLAELFDLRDEPRR